MSLLEDITVGAQQAQRAVAAAADLAAVEQLHVQVLGRKGELTQLLGKLAALPLEEKRMVGPHANVIKAELTKAFTKRRAELSQATLTARLAEEWIDVTGPATGKVRGHLHPLTQAQQRVADIFTSLGFELTDGPLVELEHYNFDVLNIPADHPARDLWDTFWIKPDPNQKDRERLLLRTHTSNMQVRSMQGRTPPLRIAVPGGRCFRHEATDATHEHTFHQVEAFVVGGGVSIGDLKGTIIAFLELFFLAKAEIRLRPSYFPFVEPGYEVDLRCIFCAGKGCRVCQGSGWLEILGAGMIHPVVLQNAGIDPARFSGFAFGVGLDRLVMLTHNIEDIRHFLSGNLQFLSQF